MQRSLFRNLTSSFYQLFINQLAGLVLFLVLSKVLSKTDFGTLNWALAILLIAFGILSFGIDQVMIKKLAAGENAPALFSSYMLHVLLTGSLFYGLMALSGVVFPGMQSSLLLYLGIGKLMVFFSLPYKQLATGLEKFHELKLMSIISNAVKAAGLLVLAFYQEVSLAWVIPLFIAGDAAELIACVFTGNKLTREKLKPAFSKPHYVALLKESLPQTGVVLFSAAMARFDWIFIGLFVSAAKLAEYSFAYKVFELASLPLLIIAPMLVPLFVRLDQNKIEHEQDDLLFLLRAQLIVASVTVLLLNLSWNPVVDWLTGGKYGAVNTGTILILSLCIPFLYLNNFLWSMHFAKGGLRTIFRLFALSFLVNMVAAIILIPVYGNEGAAVAYLLAICTQTVIYVVKTKWIRASLLWQPLFFCFGSALLSGLLARRFFSSHWLILASAVLLYLTGLLLTAQLRKKDLQSLKKVLAW
jgi:O-antigen/teichoic acid export membrane protein